MTDYRPLSYTDAKIQVESAIRDEDGVRIKTNYAKKTDIPSISITGGSAETGKYISQITASGHTLTVTKGSIPTATIASADTLGSIKVGTNLSINSTTGVLSATDTTYSAGTGLSLSGTTINHSNSVTAETSGKGSATAIPIIKYDAQGHITSVTTATVYPPTTAGTSGQLWKSDGSGAGVWVNQSALTPGVTIATDSGTNALTLAHNTKYKLTVGASTFIFTTPTDNNSDTKVKQTAQASTTTTYPLLFSAQSSPTSGTAYEAKYSTNCYIKSNELYSNGTKVLTSHQSLANYVTLNTTQTITARKNFAGGVPSSEPANGATSTPMQINFYGGSANKWNYANVPWVNKDNQTVGFFGPLQVGSDNSNGFNGFRIGLRDRADTAWTNFLTLYSSGDMSWEGPIISMRGEPLFQCRDNRGYHFDSRTSSWTCIGRHWFSLADGEWFGGLEAVLDGDYRYIQFAMNTTKTVGTDKWGPTFRIIANPYANGEYVSWLEFNGHDLRAWKQLWSGSTSSGYINTEDVSWCSELLFLVRATNMDHIGSGVWPLSRSWVQINVICDDGNANSYNMKISQTSWSQFQIIGAWNSTLVGIYGK